ncbi:MAG: glycosyltransferase [Burkholderiaceae bacterium]|nr:glycosyltransferase [Burkholderiaceae bacterium]
MSYAARPSPARVSAAAAARMPRWILWTLLAAYAFAGLFGRDPWYQDDAAGFGLMWTMASGSWADWLLPNVFGAVIAEEGPLPFWVGAAFVHLFEPLLGAAVAARLTTLLWLILATASLWYATYRLARREEAQPVAFVFGGEAGPRDYGRMLADTAVLLLLATVGIAPKLHETTAESAAVAWIALTLYGVARVLDNAGGGALLTGCAIAALALSRGLAPAVLLLVAVTAVALGQRRWRSAAIIATVAIGVAALWPLLALTLLPQRAAPYFSAWLLWNTQTLSVPGLAELTRIARNLPWYTWPLWPLALWALYSWRHALHAPHMALPATIAAALLLRLLLANAPGEEKLILLVPPLVVLAAFGATSLPRGAANALDWFAIAGASFVALALWSYYVAAHTGVPPKMAHSVVRLTPNFRYEVVAPLLGLALSATAAWIALVVWRVQTRPPMLWRGPLLNAAAVVFLWTIANALFLGPLNHARSYANTARLVAEQLTGAANGGCVVAHHLLPADRALFAWHGGLRFVAPEHEEACPLALHRDRKRSPLDDAPPPGRWELIWEGPGPIRRDETYRVYRRTG